jgi:DNA-binding LacI/PurR family transcriptional regulator
VDDVAGGALAVRHLIAIGHLNIAYVSGPGHLQQIRDRRIGAHSALSDAGLDPEALTELPTDTLDFAAGMDAGVRLLGLSNRPTAVFCANDLIALGVLQSLYAVGLTVPDDVAIVGYDDIDYAAAAAVPLTSVRQPARQWVLPPPNCSLPRWTVTARTSIAKSSSSPNSSHGTPRSPAGFNKLSYLPRRAARILRRTG